MDPLTPHQICGIITKNSISPTGKQPADFSAKQIDCAHIWKDSNYEGKKATKRRAFCYKNQHFCLANHANLQLEAPHFIQALQWPNWNAGVSLSYPGTGCRIPHQAIPCSAEKHLHSPFHTCCALFNLRDYRRNCGNSTDSLRHEFQGWYLQCHHWRNGAFL